MSGLELLANYFCKTGESVFLGFHNLPKDIEEALSEVTNNILIPADVDLKKKYPAFTPHKMGYVSEQIANRVEDIQNKALLDFDFYLGNIRAHIPFVEENLVVAGEDKGLLLVGPEFKPGQQWIVYRESALFLSRTLPKAGNSSLQLSDIVFSLAKNKSLKVSFRPDCYRVENSDYSSVRRELASWFGKEFSFSWLRDLKDEEMAEHGPNRTGVLSDGHCTQFLWSPRKDGTIHLSIEELPFKVEGNFEDAGKTVLTRFIHGVFDRKSSSFNHLDGAIHAYTKENYLKRTEQNINEFNKQYSKVKIFRIDGNLSEDPFRHLIGAFYKWNWMAVEYFSN